MMGVAWREAIFRIIKVFKDLIGNELGTPSPASENFDNYIKS